MASPWQRFMVSDEYLREHGWLDPMQQAHYALFFSGVLAGILISVIVALVAT